MYEITLYNIESLETKLLLIEAVSLGDALSIVKFFCEENELPISGKRVQYVA